MRTLEARSLDERILSPEPVTPLTFPADLNGWWDASTIPLGNGATVDAWSDLSGNGNHFAQAAIGNRPTFVKHTYNGLGTVRFDDAQNTFMTTPTFSALAQPVTVVVVCMSNSAPGYAILDTPSGAGSRNAICATSAGGDNLCSYAGAAAGSLPAIPGSTWPLAAVWGLILDNIGLIWRTSTAVIDIDQGNSGGSSGPTAWMIGRHQTSTSRRFAGDICEMAIWGRRVPLIDVAQLVTAWSEKWGF